MTILPHDNFTCGHEDVHESTLKPQLAKVLDFRDNSSKTHASQQKRVDKTLDYPNT